MQANKYKIAVYINEPVGSESRYTWHHEQDVGTKQEMKGSSKARGKVVNRTRTIAYVLLHTIPPPASKPLRQRVTVATIGAVDIRKQPGNFFMNLKARRRLSSTTSP